MQKTIIDVIGQVELTYNEKSKDFKEALKAYKKNIDRGGDIEGMLTHVAFHVTRFGYESMVEGVGYVGYKGKKSPNEPYSGIIVGEGFDDFEFQFT